MRKEGGEPPTTLFDSRPTTHPSDHYRHHPSAMIKARPTHLPPVPVLTPPQIWSMKKTEEAAAKKKPKTSAAQIRVQKGGSHPLFASV